MSCFPILALFATATHDVSDSVERLKVRSRSLPHLLGPVRSLLIHSRIQPPFTLATCLCIPSSRIAFAHVPNDVRWRLTKCNRLHAAHPHTTRSNAAYHTRQSCNRRWLNGLSHHSPRVIRLCQPRGTMPHTHAHKTTHSNVYCMRTGCRC